MLFLFRDAGGADKRDTLQPLMFDGSSMDLYQHEPHGGIKARMPWAAGGDIPFILRMHWPNDCPVLQQRIVAAPAGDPSSEIAQNVSDLVAEDRTASGSLGLAKEALNHAITQWGQVRGAVAVTSLAHFFGFLWGDTTSSPSF